MTDRELMQQSLDALEGNDLGLHYRTIDALRAALAQPETQPVNQQIESINAVFDAWRNGEDASMTLGLATPQAQPAPAVQPLTDEQIDEIWDGTFDSADPKRQLSFRQIITRAIEAHRGIGGSK